MHITMIFPIISVPFQNNISAYAVGVVSYSLMNAWIGMFFFLNVWLIRKILIELNVHIAKQGDIRKDHEKSTENLLELVSKLKLISADGITMLPFHIFLIFGILLSYWPWLQRKSAYYILVINNSCAIIHMAMAYFCSPIVKQNDEKSIVSYFSTSKLLKLTKVYASQYVGERDLELQTLSMVTINEEQKSTASTIDT